MHHPRRRNVTTFGWILKKKPVTYAKNLSQNGEPQRYSWGNAEEEEEEETDPIKPGARLRLHKITAF